MKLTRRTLLGTLCTACCARSTAGATEPARHVVAEIVDGRTFRTTDGQLVTLRGLELIAEVNAAEWLRLLIAERQVTLKNVERSGWASCIADVAWNGVDINGTMLRHGKAKSSPDCNVSKWKAYEKAARAEARGLWSMGVSYGWQGPGATVCYT